MVWLRYALVFVAVAVGVAQLVLWLNANAETTLGSSAQLMVPAMIAALIEGQQFARTNRRKPGSHAAWTFAWIGAGVAVALNVVLAYLGPAVSPEFAKLAIAPAASRQWLILLALYAGGYLICNRFFYGLGAGNQMHLMQSREEDK